MTDSTILIAANHDQKKIGPFWVLEQNFQGPMLQGQGLRSQRPGQGQRPNLQGRGQEQRLHICH